MSEMEKWMILERHKQGIPPKQICDEVNRSYGSILRLLKQKGISLARGPWDTLTEDEQNQCMTDYQRGYSLSYLQSAYNIGLSKLNKEIQERGIQPPSQHLTGIERLHDCKEHVIAEYQKERIGTREMARRFGVHEGTMKVFLQQAVGLKPRGAQAGNLNPMSKDRSVDSKDRDNGKYWARRTVELCIGRKLPKDWVIHHMNENPRDQRHSNLWLFPSAECHGRYHAQQLERLAAGGAISASQTALENDGLWLQQLLVLMQSEPDKVEQLLSCRQE
jgi:hypothetical protein